MAATQEPVRPGEGASLLSKVAATVLMVAVFGGAAVAAVIGVGSIDRNPAPAPPQEPVDPASAFTGMELGQFQFERLSCASCHGQHGEGGVVNTNYLQETNPALDLMAERLMLFDPEDADLAVGWLIGDEEWPGPEAEPPFRTYPRFVAQLDNVRTVIREGSTAGKSDPDGPEPAAMPAWGGVLDDSAVDALIAYLVTLYDWDE